MPHEICLKIKHDFTMYREQAKLTQEELAAKIGVSKNTISNWERGKTLPTLNPEQINILCNTLGISPDDFLACFLK